MLQDMFDPTSFAMTEAASAEAAESATKAGESAIKGIDAFRDLSFEELIAGLSKRLVDFAIDVAVAIIVFYIGKFVIKRIYSIIGAILVRRDVDRSLTTFILSFVKIVLYFILIVTVIGILGIETSSFLAIFASAGIAIGMALSGTLQNFAGGVLILLLKPYKIGDYIEAQGYAGTVREIQIFHTIITTYDNKVIIIPNGGLSTSSINNWSRESYRRVSWDIAITYGDNVAVAREAILAMFATDARIVQDPDKECPEDASDCAEAMEAAEHQPKKRGFLRRLFSSQREAVQRLKDSTDSKIKQLKVAVVKAPSIVVKELADSSVNLGVRAWVHTADYWTVFYEYNERIYAELPKHGIRFPFPQMDVHVIP